VKQVFPTIIGSPTSIAPVSITFSDFISASTFTTARRCCGVFSWFWLRIQTADLLTYLLT